MREFDLIDRFFAHQGFARSDVALGVGDDCALLRPAAGELLAVTVDAMVEGVHFPPETAPEALGHKALAVSLSDLAAMGARPAWATLVLSLPQADPEWVGRFSGALLALATGHEVALVGGDTVRGPRAFTTSLHGFVPEGLALTRSGARPGDLIYATGTLGDAGAGLAVAQGRLDPPPETARWLRERLDRPTARISSGLALRGIASSAIDISDGVCGDLGHILQQSGVGATVHAARLPVSDALGLAVPDAGQRQRLALTAGDDFELLFTVPPARAALAEGRLSRLPGGLTRIGIIDAEPGLRVLGPDGPLAIAQGGYDHFGAGG